MTYIDWLKNLSQFQRERYLALEIMPGVVADAIHHKVYTSIGELNIDSTSILLLNSYDANDCLKITRINTNASNNIPYLAAAVDLVTFSHLGCLFPLFSQTLSVAYWHPIDAGVAMVCNGTYPMLDINLVYAKLIQQFNETNLEDKCNSSTEPVLVYIAYHLRKALMEGLDIVDQLAKLYEIHLKLKVLYNKFNKCSHGKYFLNRKVRKDIEILINSNCWRDLRPLRNLNNHAGYIKDNPIDYTDALAAICMDIRYGIYLVLKNLIQS